MIITTKKFSDYFTMPIKYLNDTYYLNNVLENEEIDVSINKNKKTMVINKILKASPFRIKPLCNISQNCGGCKFQHATYKHQLDLKTNMVKELFKPLKVNDIIGMEKPYHYRNKNQVVFGLDDRKKLVSGFYEEFSHKIINYDTCLLQSEVADKIINTIKDLMQKMHITPYNEQTKKGLIKHVVIKRSDALNQTMVIIVTSELVFPGKNNFIKALLAKHKDITTIIQSINTKNSTFVLGDKEVILYGKGYINDILCDKKFKISSKSFYQINPIQTKILYETAIKEAKLTKNDVVIDAYSGIGTIGIIASSYVSKVIGVELEKQAVEDAIENVKMNNIKNIKFFNDDATRFINNMANKKEHIDVVILDPPRKGSTESFLKSLLKLKPKKIIYISCDPHTQKEDIKYLDKEYKVDFIQPVDMFPHTIHVESVVSLSRK